MAKGWAMLTPLWGRSPWKWGGLALITVLIILLPHSVQAQTNPGTGSRSAPIVVDGNVLFEVRGTETLAASDRAEEINLKLQQEVNAPEPVELFVVREKNAVFVKSRTTEEDIISVTEADVKARAALDPEDLKDEAFEQAKAWAGTLETAVQRGQLERRPDYLQRAARYSITIAIGAIALHGLLHIAGRFGSRWFSQWRENRSHPLIAWERTLRLFWQLALLGIQLGLWMTVIYLVTDIFPQARTWRYLFSTARLVTLGDRGYSALGLLLIGLTAIALWFAVSLVTQLLRLYVSSQTNTDPRVQDILSVILQYALVFLIGVIMLQAWGVDVSSLTILASVLGVGLGFGVQNITNNFISGFIITLERPIQVGDFINVGELVGEVQRVGARSTEIRTLDRVTIIVPNSRFLESEVINWSHGNPVSRLRLPVGVAYGSDIEQVKTALLEAARRHREVLLTPKPEVWFQGFGDSSLNFDVLVWTGEPRKQFEVKSDLYYEVETSLRRHGIEIPFPQRDLHLRSPHLETLLQALLHHFNGSSPSALAFPQDFAHASLPSSAVSFDFLATLDFDRLADDMRSGRGIPVGDRHYRFNHYPRCFTGTDAVAWLVQQQGYTREEAIVIGQGLLQQGLIKSVIDDARFHDGYYFYRFYQDEQALSRQAHRNASSSPATLPPHPNPSDVDPPPSPLS